MNYVSKGSFGRDAEGPRSQSESMENELNQVNSVKKSENNTSWS